MPLTDPRSKVAQLPAHLLDGVHDRLRRRVPQRAIRAWLLDRGHRISAPSLSGYAKAWHRRADDVAAIMEAAALAREAGRPLADVAQDLAAASAAWAATLAATKLPDDDENGEVDRALGRAARMVALHREIEAAAALARARREAEKEGTDPGIDADHDETERRFDQQLGIA